MDLNNYNLGKYIMYAVNNPKKYPSRPFLYKEPKRKVMTAEDMERIMKKNTLALGGKVNDGD